MSDMDDMREAIEGDMNTPTPAPDDSVPEISWERDDASQSIHDLMVIMTDKFGISFEPAPDHDDEDGYFHYFIRKV